MKDPKLNAAFNENKNRKKATECSGQIKGYCPKYKDQQDKNLSSLQIAVYQEQSTVLTI